MKFKDPTGLYSGGYTSEEVMPNTSHNQRGVVQTEVTTGNIQLQGRVDPTASFITMKSYTTSQLDEVVLAPYMRVIVSTGSDGTAWLSVTN